MEKAPITCRSLEKYYHVDGDELERQYKDHLSDYRDWEEAGHATDWLVYPENMGPRLSIDETSISDGDLYTVVTNKDAKGRKGAIVAIVKGVASGDITSALERIPQDKLDAVREVTMDLSNSMRKSACIFHNARKTIDRFHVQKLALDAVQEMRIEARWKAIEVDNELSRKARANDEKYEPELLANGDTRRELLARSRYLLFKSPDKWSESQKTRAEILFSEYPDIKTAFSLAHGLRCIYGKNTCKGAARISLARWYNKVEESGFKSFAVIAGTLYDHYEEVLNFFEDRQTNASAESFNCKIKDFRRQLRGVSDMGFFLYRLTKIYA